MSHKNLFEGGKRRAGIEGRRRFVEVHALIVQIDVMYCCFQDCGLDQQSRLHIAVMTAQPL
jgi:hypothetical protein